MRKKLFIVEVDWSNTEYTTLPKYKLEASLILEWNGGKGLGPKVTVNEVPERCMLIISAPEPELNQSLKSREH